MYGDSCSPYSCKSNCNLKMFVFDERAEENQQQAQSTQWACLRDSNPGPIGKWPSAVTTAPPSILIKVVYVLNVPAQ